MANWVLPILGSALVLGVYDVFKKHAVRENSVMPVLFLATLSGSLFYMLLTGTRIILTPGSFALDLRGEVLFLVALKSTLVATSWAFVYYGREYRREGCRGGHQNTGEERPVIKQLTIHNS